MSVQPRFAVRTSHSHCTQRKRVAEGCRHKERAKEMAKGDGKRGEVGSETSSRKFLSVPLKAQPGGASWCFKTRLTRFPPRLARSTDFTYLLLVRMAQHRSN